jgi:hypothetical protein
MIRNSRVAVILKFTFIVTMVITLSTASVSLWGGKSEKIMDIPELLIEETMTLAQFGQANELPNSVLKAVFGLQSKSDLQKMLSEFSLSKDQIQKKVEGASALHTEEKSKDWIKILIKFASWIAFLIFVFVLMRRRRVTPGVRKGLYLAGISIFGIILGSDPSAMGTVKDAITLYASKGVIFPPRMIALTVFLLMVLVANKFICSWGCQAGVLQDMIFRLNRNEKDTKGIIRQYKPSFLVTNTFRILFFGVFTLAAFLWSVDIIEFIDPFKVYKPAALGAAGIGFVGLLLVSSLFIYRPWCHLFCPFGLVGWLVEKISIFKIKVNYDTCISCEACANCIDVCPTDSVCLGAGKRDVPPEGKFQSTTAS